MAEIHLAAANRLFKQTEPALTVDRSSMEWLAEERRLTRIPKLIAA